MCTEKFVNGMQYCVANLEPDTADGISPSKSRRRHKLTQIVHRAEKHNGPHTNVSNSSSNTPLPPSHRLRHASAS
jgi:hypothetical protein